MTWSTASGTLVIGGVDAQLRVAPAASYGRVDAGEALDLARPRARVQALGVTALALLDGRVDEHLEERQVRLLVRLAQVLPVGGQRRDQRHHGDRSRVGHQTGHLADAADVLGALGRT